MGDASFFCDVSIGGVIEQSPEEVRNGIHKSACGRTWICRFCSTAKMVLFDSPRASSLLRGLQFTSRILATQAKELWLMDANGI